MRDWWLRTLLVLQRPRPVFVALRDDDPEAVGERGEPVLLIVWLAGMAAVLAQATTYLNDETRDGLVLALYVFAAGGISGAFAYFVVGWLLYRVSRALGSHGNFRRSRHVLAFAATPIALSLVLWPFKVALYGDDWFRSGGRDAGRAAALFGLASAAFLVWTLALVMIGVRAVHGWSWARSAVATACTLLPPVVLSLAFVLR
ncbi:MAG: Yip1 family protein [Gaiellaceae bacterium]